MRLISSLQVNVKNFEKSTSITIHLKLLQIAELTILSVPYCHDSICRETFHCNFLATTYL